jgi:hypothetical protein
MTDSPGQVIQNDGMLLFYFQLVLPQIHGIIEYGLITSGM